MPVRSACTVALILCLMASFPIPLRAACKRPLPTSALQDLDDRVDSDPAGVNAEVLRRLSALRTDDLMSAELYAVSASALDLQDDDAQSRAAVAAGRERLQRLPQDDTRRGLEVRFSLIAADSPLSPSNMAASIEDLTRLERTLPAQSLDHACLLIVRSRLNTQLIHNEEATKDGFVAYRIATDLHAPEAAADAAYQLAMTYLGAGLLEDAERMAEEAIAYNRATHKIAQLSNALYMKSQILKDTRDYAAALAALAESRAISVQLKADIDVAFADEERCIVMVHMNRPDDAEKSCLSADSVWKRIGRADMQAVTEDNLARVDLMRGKPAAALQRLDAILRSKMERIAPNHLPELYQYRSEALTGLGRFKEALKDLQESNRLTTANDAQRRSLAAATINARFTVAGAEDEKRALETQMIQERRLAADQEHKSRLILALTVAAGLLFGLIAYLMWNLARRERNLRRATETMETHARVISTVREGVLLVDERDRIEFANPPVLRLFGRSLQEVQGGSLNLLGLRRESLEGPTEEVGAGPTEGARELHLRDPAGTPVTMLVTSSRLTLARRTLLVCVLQDVTELRQLERTVLLDASEERNRLSSEVHEGIAQDLTGIALLLKSVGGRNESDASTLEFINGYVNQVLERARTLARGLSPVQVAGTSLPLALSLCAAEISAAGSIPVTCECELGDLQLRAPDCDHLYRIARACLRSAARHPGCCKIALDVRSTHQALVLTCVAEGESLPGHRGEDDPAWRTIAYLARVLGGTARIEALTPGRMANIVAIPLESLQRPWEGTAKIGEMGLPGN
jgi:PAS domain S-box-containing protein